MYISRAIEKSFLKKLKPNKVLVLLGARRIGKTSFIKKVLLNFKKDVLEINGEDFSTIEILKNRTVENYKRLIGTKTILFIDEAQNVPDIGNILKLMVDEIKGIKIIVTGSSMFDLKTKLGEPLTGRKTTFLLYPLAQMEFSQTETLIQTKSRLEERLLFGAYPELLQYKSDTDKVNYLKELVNDYLFKDILAFEGVKNASKLVDLLRLIAFQIGKEVSMEELGRQLGMSKNTVERYLDLLAKTFVVFKLQGFSRNLRNEITKSSKWYFCDIGIRNTLIANFNSINLRNDVGELWENYVIAERIKYQQYKGILVNNYFWRTHQQQEIDWIEDGNGKLFAYEIKWNEKKQIKAPGAWQQAYPDSKFELITPKNYLNWICD
ncbi:MAG: ATPase [Bacteroidetes bacterium RIFCSPLOWO2_12_FULL_35_15]|nr:MAG: ATPase [Bacteroidetes bacterium RIFCSPLOWO2_12_FULL_35_15]